MTDTHTWAAEYVAKLKAQHSTTCLGYLNDILCDCLGYINPLYCFCEGENDE